MNTAVNSCILVYWPASDAMAFKHFLVLRTKQPGVANLDGVAKVLPPILSQPLYLPR